LIPSARKGGKMNPKNTSIGCIENQVQQINVVDKNVLFGVKSQQMLAKMSIFGAPNMRW
jgi:hypothetical protein